MKMVAVPFLYKEQEYFSLVRVKPRWECIKLEVTIMNGDLERVFYGHHVFTSDGKDVKCDCQPVDSNVRELHSCILSALDYYFKSYPLRRA